MTPPLQIGSNIAARRRARGLTQEQLAAQLGVSAPAVSKWETDSSYPDITLLCPLARALGCRVDELLQFVPSMTEEEATEKLNDVLHTALTGARAEAEQALTDLLRAYPNCPALQYQAAIGWSAFQVFFPDAAPADRERWQSNARALWEALHTGADPSMAQYAAHQLASRAVEQGDLDRAEALLAELPRQTIDPTIVRYLLESKRGDTEAARATLQKRLYALAHQTYTLLATLPAVLPEPERQLAAARAIHELARLFGLLDSSGLVALEPLLKLDRIEEAAAMLERYVDVLTGPLPQPDPDLFAPTLPMRSGEPMSEDPDLSQLRRMLYRQMSAEPLYAPLRENPRGRAALERLAE